jgi:hypothetical protein
LKQWKSERSRLFTNRLKGPSPCLPITDYRAACRGGSKVEFAAKLGTVVQESDASCSWLELTIDGALLPRNKVEPLYKDANELIAIFVASIRTARSTLSNQRIPEFLQS